jgi:hypothetical protein
MSPRGDPISRRALGRALLARQGLLERSTIPALAMVERLVAIQAQVPIDPYVALWTRLAGFDPLELSGLMESRRVARATLLRTTIHLASRRDLRWIRPLVQPVVERNFRSGSPFGRRLPGVDMAEVRSVARDAMGVAPRTRPELRTILGERWPDRDADAMAVGVCILEPLVQATPRGLWGRAGQPAWAPMSAWLGAPLDGSRSLDDLALRYLAAFGPASAADATAWSGLTHLGEVFARLRPRLHAFRTEAGRELFDLPDAPRPDPDTPAPVRFLPQYDNVILGHADRSRIVPDGVAAMQWPEVWVGTYLVDGELAGTWRVAAEATAPLLELRPLAPPDRRTRGELEAEGLALAGFLRPGATAIGVRWLGR